MYSSYSVAAAACSCVFPALAAVAVGLRFRARTIQKIKFKMDDYLVVVALVLAAAYCFIVLNGSFNASIGQDLTTITPPQFTYYQQHLYFGVIIAHLSYGFSKLSVLCFYKRVFAIEEFRKYANGGIIVVLMFMLAATITQIFSAWPISNWWTLGAGYSINYGAFITSFAAIDLALDIIILCLPIPVIKSLHIDNRKKVLLFGIFQMGLFCVVATAVRLYFGYELSLAGSGQPVSDARFSYVSVNNVIWAEVEGCCSVIAACLPTLGPIVKLVKLPKSVTNSIQSLLRTITRSDSKSSSKQNSGKDDWLPLSESTRNLTSIQRGDKNAAKEAREIRVERSFATEYA